MKKIGLLLATTVLAIAMFGSCSVQQPSSRQVMTISNSFFLA